MGSFRLDDVGKPWETVRDFYGFPGNSRNFLDNRGFFGISMKSSRISMNFYGFSGRKEQFYVLIYVLMLDL